MHIGLASLPACAPDVLDTVHALTRQASNLGVGLVCFSAQAMTCADDPSPLAHDLACLARDCGVALVAPIFVEATGYDTVAILDATGQMVAMHEPATSHRSPVFEVGGLCLGVVVGDALWRRGDLVRTVVRHGAQLVLHPHGTILDGDAVPPRTWCDPDASFHEKTLVCRSAEAGVPVASVGPAHPRQAAATCVVAPDGSCLCHQPYGQPGLLIHRWHGASHGLDALG